MNHNTWNATNSTADSWAETKQPTISESWSKLCPDVGCGWQLNLEMKDSDVDELTASHSDELM
jgi:hypothetical protein